MKNFTVSTPKNTKIDKNLIHSVIFELINKLGFTIESLSMNFVTPELMREINKQYLKHNIDTDIITFNYSGNTKNLDGEIFISISQAIDNAIRFNVHLDSEIIRLIVHGILHLLGYDDKDSNEKKNMKKVENRLTSELSEKFRNFVIEYDY